MPPIFTSLFAAYISYIFYIGNIEPMPRASISWLAAYILSYIFLI